jgi:hypothetical protein
MDTFEVIGAFVDRERVDPEALKQALATDEGREFLIDLVMLREITLEQPSAAAPVTKAERRAPRLAWAASLAAAVLGGYIAGRTIAAAPLATPDAAPIPLAPISTPAIPPPPAPTTVIILEPGVDWHEGTGG